MRCGGTLLRLPRRTWSSTSSPTQGQARPRGDPYGCARLPRTRSPPVRSTLSGSSSCSGRGARRDRRAIRTLAAAVLGRALALWRGSALSDVSHADFAAFDAARLDEARLDCAEERLRPSSSSGSARGARRGGRLAAEHPHRERIRAVHMVALYRAGRQVEALEASAPPTRACWRSSVSSPVRTSVRSSARSCARTRRWRRLRRRRSTPVATGRSPTDRARARFARATSACAARRRSARDPGRCRRERETRLARALRLREPAALRERPRDRRAVGSP